jgi:hypothetical protein
MLTQEIGSVTVRGIGRIINEEKTLLAFEEQSGTCQPLVYHGALVAV